MMKFRQRPPQEETQPPNTLIGVSSSFRGTLMVTGTLRIDGEFEGDILNCERLEIGEHGIMRADVEVREAVIRGRWDRNLSRKLRALHEPGRSYTDRTEVLDTVLDALLRERGLRLQYGADPSAARWLEPQQALTLVLYRRALYLLARPAEGGPTRRLSVTKIHAALLDGPLPYPTDWDPDAELRGWFGIHAGGRRGHIVIDFAPEVAHYVAARRWGEDQVLRPTTGGGIRLEMDSGGPELVRWVLEWGDRARVVGPDGLREEVRAQLGRACALYDQEVVPWS